MPLPSELDTDTFREKWDEWLHYRKTARRKKVSELAAKQQLSKLAKAGEAAAIEAIDISIANDWTGLFPEIQRTDAARPQWVIDKRMREIETKIELLGPPPPGSALRNEYLQLIAERRSAKKLTHRGRT